VADRDTRKGETYIREEIIRFAESLYARHDISLGRAFGAPSREGMPEIQVAPLEGRFLGMLCSLLAVRKAVEVGTLAGYSAIHMARGMPSGSSLWTLEKDPNHARVARENIAWANLEERVTVLEGEALASLGGLEEEAPFDAVFLDADKGRYDRYAAWAADHLRPGGLLLADNAFFFGRLLEEEPEAQAMRRFHRLVADRFEATCIPTPDGLVVAIRKE